MTYIELTELIKLHNIPENVKLQSDSGWEVDATDMNGVFYNPIENIIVFTMSPEDSRYKFYEQKPWMKLEKNATDKKETAVFRDEMEITIKMTKVDSDQYFCKGQRVSFDLPWSIYRVNHDFYMPYYRIYIGGHLMAMRFSETTCYEYLRNVSREEAHFAGEFKKKKESDETDKKETAERCSCCGEECFESDYPEVVFRDEENAICENCSIDYEQANGQVRKRIHHR